MKAWRPFIMLFGVALFAALIGHVTIDVLGDYCLAHDSYDDLDHSSRELVAFGALLVALVGTTFAIRAAIHEARGSENAFCQALRSALPRNTPLFAAGTVCVAILALCAMEYCDALLAGHAVDDASDLFGGSVLFGGTIVSTIAAALSLIAVRFVRRLAKSRIVAQVCVAFLRRDHAADFEREAFRDRTHRLVYRIHYACRQIAGRAPPLPR